MGVWIIFSRSLIPTFFEVNFNIDLENNLLFSILNLIILIFFFLIVSLKFGLRFIFLKKLVKNSPFNVTNCVFWGLKQLCYPIIVTGALGFGTNIVDNTSERYGYIPPFQHYTDSMNYYLNQRVSRKIGTEDLSNYDLVQGETNISNFLRKNQERTLAKRKELIEIFNSQQQGEQIRRASQEVRKNEN